MIRMYILLYVNYPSKFLKNEMFFSPIRWGKIRMLDCTGYWQRRDAGGACVCC